MIVRVIKDSNYVVLNRTAASDERLSYKAVGIHTYLMGKPDYWEGNETDIVRRHNDGRAAVRSGIEELIAHGYLTRVRVVDKGKVMGWRLDTYETPAANPHYVEGAAPTTITEVLGEPEYENRIVDSKPEYDNQNVAQKPQCDFLHVDFPHVENRIHSNNSFSTSNEEQITEQSAVGTLNAPPVPSLSLSEQFHKLIEDLRDAKNKAASLRAIYVLCFGEHGDMPDYGYFGTAARKVGGAGRLAELMWLQVTSPPKGDILAYLIARSKGKGAPVSKIEGNNSAMDNYEEIKIRHGATA